MQIGVIQAEALLDRKRASPSLVIEADWPDVQLVERSVKGLAAEAVFHSARKGR